MYFNYFLPNKTKVTLDDLLAIGLGYAFDPETGANPKTPFTPRAVTNGPGGQHGMMVSLSSQYCGYYQAAQTWKQEVDCEYWVGMWTDKRPTPETLQRDNIIEGGSLRLDDGHVWTFPSAYHFEDYDGEILYRHTLPSQLTRNEAGEWVPGEIKQRYRELWRLACSIQDELSRDEPVLNSDLDNAVIECFRCNYRVSAMEIDMLGIHDDTVRIRVPRILLDMDDRDILFKKKLIAHATGTSTAGQSELRPDVDTVDTCRPSAT